MQPYNGVIKLTRYHSITQLKMYTLGTEQNFEVLMMVNVKK